MKIGDVVYLKTGDDPGAKQVVGILRRDKSTTYEIRSGKDEPTWHFAFELQKDPTTKRIKGLYNEGKKGCTI